MRWLPDVTAYPLVIACVLAIACALVIATPATASGNSFACPSPNHHDGDAIRCRGGSKSMRLYGIDAPEMPGACRPGRACTPGDPFAARDYLAALTAGHAVNCEQLDTDRYDRAIVRCAADGADLSCAMVAAGHAVERYGRLACRADGPLTARARPSPDFEPRVDTPPSPVAVAVAVAVDTGPARNQPATAGTDSSPDQDWPWYALPLWLACINIASGIAMIVDKTRATAQHYRRVNRIAESTLLLMAAAGGSPATYAVQQRLRHKTAKQPFSIMLRIIIAVQVGVCGWWLWSLLKG
jgi:endonuclease YncB( thermonuclease family)/uncharacterized membrane protein YsdA (DUF1294 family)